jgi:hypothetical protein
MFERNISRDEVLDVLYNGEMIADYPTDQPYPSQLLLGRPNGRPLHVLVGVASQTKTCVVVTAYDPDPNLWDADLKQRHQT